MPAKLDAAHARRRAGTPGGDDPAFVAADLAAFEAQQVAIDLALQATGLLFEVGGASALDGDRQLDRHWRNARTLASHNPAILRERSIGDYRLNSVSPRSFGETPAAAAKQS